MAAARTAGCCSNPPVPLGQVPALGVGLTFIGVQMNGDHRSVSRDVGCLARVRRSSSMGMRQLSRWYRHQLAEFIGACLRARRSPTNHPATSPAATETVAIAAMPARPITTPSWDPAPEAFTNTTV